VQYTMVSLVTTHLAHSTIKNSMLRQLFVRGALPTVRILHAHPGHFQVRNVQRQLKVQEVVVVLYNAAIPTGNETPNLSHQLSNRHAPRLIVFLSMIRPAHSSAQAQAPQIPSNTTLPSVQPMVVNGKLKCRKTPTGQSARWSYDEEG